MPRVKSNHAAVGRTLAALVVLAGAAAGLSACNTMKGFGQDMAAAGNAITGSSQHLQNDMSGSSTPPQAQPQQ